MCEPLKVLCSDVTRFDCAVVARLSALLGRQNATATMPPAGNSDESEVLHVISYAPTPTQRRYVG